LSKGLIEGDLTDELESIKNWKVPVCVVFGKDETLVKTTYLDNYPALWNNKVFLIKNGGHFINEEQPEAFNNILLFFAEEVFR
jgi:pimeloyl-ACP methyl ester carboxylesterase